MSKACYLLTGKSIETHELSTSSRTLVRDIYLKMWGRDIVVILMARLRAGRSGVRIPVGARDFSLLQNIEAGFGANLTSYSVGTGVLSQG
jgi:hypothetical protein